METTTTTTHTEKFDQALENALICLLWQGFEHATAETVDGFEFGDDMDSYSGDPNDTGVIPTDVVAEISGELRAFFDAGVLDLINELDSSIWDDAEQIGHDWVLTSYGHGTGFWDRYNSASEEGKVGEALTELAHLHPCPEVSFDLDDNAAFTS